MVTTPAGTAARANTVAAVTVHDRVHWLIFVISFSA